jgi:hypothetical protein
MKLKGHLEEYPLNELMTILENRSETGRLQVAFELGAGVFDLKDGKIVAATVGSLTGPAAVRVALLMNPAPFTFDDTAINTAAIDDGELNFEVQTVTPELFALPTDTGTERRGPVTVNLPVSSNANSHIRLNPKEVLIYIHRHTLGLTIVILLMVSVPIVIAITGNDANDGRPPAPVPVLESNQRRSAPATLEKKLADHVEKPAVAAVSPVAGGPPPMAQPEPSREVKSTAAPVSAQLSTAAQSASRKEYQQPSSTIEKVPQSKPTAPAVISVVMHIEQGRIIEAYVKDHHPGLEAFEATAIRLARQRRYASDKVGTETVLIKVSADR